MSGKYGTTLLDVRSVNAALTNTTRIIVSTPWTPAAVPGCILYAGAYQEARATRNTQPVLVDGACEDVSRWEAHSGALLSNQPGGVSGNCMRVAYNGAANPLAGQSIGIVGNRYRASGWFRGDGAKRPEVLVFNSLALGLASNEWQSFAADQTMGASGIFGLRCTTAAAGYAEFDSLTLSNLSVKTYTPAFTTVAGAALGQSSAALMPWIDQTAGALRFDGTADNMSLSGALSSWKCLHDGTGVTVLIALKRTTSGDYILSTDNAINTNVGVYLRRASDPGTAELRVHNGSGTPVCTVTQTGLTIDTPHVLEYSLSTEDGAEITVDGVSNAAALTGSCSSSNPTYAPMFMARQGGGWLAGYLYDILVIARRLAPTDPERVAARRYMAALCGAVVP